MSFGSLKFAKLESLRFVCLRHFHFQPDRFKRWVHAWSIVRSVKHSFPENDVWVFPNGFRDGNRSQLMNLFVIRNDGSIAEDAFRVRPLPQDVDRQLSVSYGVGQMLARLGRVSGFSFIHV